MISHNLIEILTIIASVATIGLVIMNQPQTNDTFGSAGAGVHSRRGFEKQVHNLTIVTSGILLVLVLLGQVLR